MTDLRLSTYKVFPSRFTPTGPKGERGPSAYEIAVKNGFVGTESEWLDSLASNNVDLTNYATKQALEAVQAEIDIPNLTLIFLNKLI